MSLAFITSSVEVHSSHLQACTVERGGNTEENVAGDEIVLMKYKSEKI
jgi:hypothetical protein